MSEQPHEHDDEGNCIEPEGYEPPSRRFDPWNIVGIALTTAAGLAHTAAQGLNLAAQECWTHARWREKQHDAAIEWEQQLAERQEMAEAYEKLVGMDTLWLEPKEDS